MPCTHALGGRLPSREGERLPHRGEWREHVLVGEQLVELAVVEHLMSR